MNSWLKNQKHISKMENPWKLESHENEYIAKHPPLKNGKKMQVLAILCEEVKAI